MNDNASEKWPSVHVPGPGSSSYWEQFGTKDSLPYGQPYVQPAVSAIKNEPMAIVSLVLGLIGFASWGWCAAFPPLLGASAIVTGIVAHRRIRRAPDAFKGHGLAMGGIITGGLGLALVLAVFGLVGAAFFMETRY